MATTATPSISDSSGGAVSHDAHPRTGSRIWTSRLIGGLFLAGFVVYGTGSVLVSSVVDGPRVAADA